MLLDIISYRTNLHILLLKYPPYVVIKLKMGTLAAIKAETHEQSVLCLVVELCSLSISVVHTCFIYLFIFSSLLCVYTHTHTKGSLIAKYYFSAELAVRYHKEVFMHVVSWGIQR